MPRDSVQETFNRLTELPGVMGAILVDGSGTVLRSNVNESASQVYANRLVQLVTMSRDLVRDVEPSDDLAYVRLRTRKQELMVATESQHTIIVIQDVQSLDQTRRSTSASARNSTAYDRGSVS
ncbi:uncharacterized protein Dana_GF19684 [Drosophila ananassae]|uniref:Roadblock/LAMTOR2 domain-containing protein n=1 Tax=Drosophila ananassae TaxID=7217 RepID=B3MNR8_DROAN|nr:dynein light chain roadblock-type 2 [Drosophila ananassae]EDV31155.1 uncharacterized protein Dana_GF19684 [Drosophila ananassae]KAH8350561.1 hypothetical protein KR067_008695 [Drosophila pandora]